MRDLGQPNILLSLGQPLKYYLNQFGMRKELKNFILAILATDFLIDGRHSTIGGLRLGG